MTVSVENVASLYDLINVVCARTVRLDEMSWSREDNHDHLGSSESSWRLEVLGLNESGDDKAWHGMAGKTVQLAVRGVGRTRNRQMKGMAESIGQRNGRETRW